LCQDSEKLISRIEGKIKIFNNIKNILSPARITDNNLEFIRLFEQLKINYIKNIEMFNQLTSIKLENGSGIIRIEDRVKMITNINAILKTLRKHSDIIPEYNFNLDEISALDLNLLEFSSPKLTDSALEMHDLNVKIEES
jgi:hypothetical protein